MGAPQLPTEKDRSIPLFTEARGEACYGRELTVEIRRWRWKYGASLKDWLFAQKYGSPYLNGSAVLLE